jgi:tetratricopeptide (TPR) repeat protein
MTPVEQSPTTASARLRLRRSRLPLLLLLLLLLLPVGLYVWTAPAREERALRNASFDQLLAASKRDPDNARLFYYMGLRLRQFGQTAPARAAFERAASLDRDDEEAWLAWAATAGALSGDREAYAALTAFKNIHPDSARVHRALALFYHQQDARQRAYDESLAAARLNPQEPANWQLAGTDAFVMRRYADSEAAFRQAVTLAPQDWRNHLGLAESLRALQRGEEALAHYREANRLAPDEPSANLMLGRALLERAASDSEVADAQKLLLRAASRQPTASALVEVGHSYVRQQRWQEARRALEQAGRLAPADPGIHFDLSRVCLRLGDREGAARETALHQETLAYQSEKLNLLSQMYQVQNDPDIRLKLARLCAAHGDYAEAALEYRRLIARAPDLAAAKKELAALERRQPELAQHPLALPISAAQDALPLTVLLRDADAMLQAKRYPEAERAFLHALERDPNSAQAAQGLGLALDAQGKTDDAFRALQHAVKLNPDLPQAEFALAELYYDAGFPDECTRRLEKLTQQVTDNAEYWHALGAAGSNAESRYVASEEADRRAVSLAPANPVYLRDLADMEQKNHRFAQAEADYRRGLALAPGDASLLYRLGRFLLLDQPTPERRQEAERMLTQAIQNEPNSTGARFEMGRLLLARGDAKQAAAHLEKAITVNPGYTAAYYQLSRAYDRLGDKALSARCLAVFRTISEYESELYNTEEQAHNNLNDANLRLKLARLYARGDQNAKAINQYQMCLHLDPRNQTARKELNTLVAQLMAQGRMPSMSALNGMLLASIKVR